LGWGFGWLNPGWPKLIKIPNYWIRGLILEARIKEVIGGKFRAPRKERVLGKGRNLRKEDLGLRKVKVPKRKGIGPLWGYCGELPFPKIPSFISY